MESEQLTVSEEDGFGSLTIIATTPMVLLTPFSLETSLGADSCSLAMR